MQNFEFHYPTRIVFGKETVGKLGGLLPTSARALILHDGLSPGVNGVLNEVHGITSLGEHRDVTLTTSRLILETAL